MHTIQCLLGVIIGQLLALTLMLAWYMAGRSK